MSDQLMYALVAASDGLQPYREYRALVSFGAMFVFAALIAVVAVGAIVSARFRRWLGIG